MLNLGTKTTTGAGSSIDVGTLTPPLSAQISGNTSSGSGSATVKIQVSNTGGSNDYEWIDAGTVYLVLGTTVTTDGFTIDSNWPFIRMYVVSISGTGASITGLLGG